MNKISIIQYDFNDSIKENIEFIYSQDEIITREIYQESKINKNILDF